MLAIMIFSLICTLVISAVAIYNIVKFLVITNRFIYKINELGNNKNVALQARLVSIDQNNLISPITKKPCCWYRLSLDISSQVPILTGPWRPLDKFSTDRVIEIRDNKGKALLATHLAKVYTGNEATFYLNSHPNLKDPEEIQLALQDSNANVFIKGMNWVSSGNLHVANDPQKEGRSAFGFLRSYMTPFVYRLTEEVLVDNQDVYIFGENHLVNGPLINGPLGDTASTLAFNLYVEKHGLGDIKNFISPGNSPNNFLICSDISLATVDYKIRGIICGILALVLLVLTIFF